MAGDGPISGNPLVACAPGIAAALTAAASV